MISYGVTEGLQVLIQGKLPSQTAVINLNGKKGWAYILFYEICRHLLTVSRS